MNISEINVHYEPEIKEKLKNHLIETIQMCLEVMDEVYERYLNGQISREKYTEKLKVWEDRYFDKKRELELLTSDKNV